MKKLFKDVSVKCAAFLMAYYITNAVFQSYMSLFYADRGMSNTQIGLINALIALVSIFSMQLWGAIGDGAKKRNLLLCFMCLGSAAIMLVTHFANGIFMFTLLACLFAFIYTSIQPMGDSIVLTSLEKENRPFGPVRTCGGMAFAVMCMLYGYVTDAFSSEIVVYSVCALCVLSAAAAMYLPRVGGGQKKDRSGMLRLFKDKELLKLFLLMIPLQITMGYFYAFFSPFVRDDMNGGTILGWCYFISATSEVPFLILSDKLFKKYGAGRLMCFSALTLFIRWTLVATAGGIVQVVLSQLFHCWGFIVITVTLSKYVQATVPDEKKASGQMLISVFGFGVARVIGYFGGGVLSDMLSRQSVFYISAAVCLVCFVISAPYYLKHSPLNGAGKSA